MGVLLSIGFTVFMLVIAIVGLCFEAAITIMPYISGMFIVLLIYTEVPFADTLIPDHSAISYFFDLVIVETVIAALMHIRLIGEAAALLFSEIMVGIISMFILDSIEPDSIGYCIFVSVVYLLGNAVFLGANVGRHKSMEKNSPAGVIISSCMCAFIAYFIVAIPTELLWEKYISEFHPTAVGIFSVAYCVLRIVVCGGIILNGIYRVFQQHRSPITI